MNQFNLFVIFRCDGLAIPRTVFISVQDLESIPFQNSSLVSRRKTIPLRCFFNRNTMPNIHLFSCYVSVVETVAPTGSAALFILKLKNGATLNTWHGSLLRRPIMATKILLHTSQVCMIICIGWYPVTVSWSMPIRNILENQTHLFN